MIDMLESVRTDAHALLTISRSQKCRYNKELAKLTTENKALEDEVKKLQKAVCETKHIKKNPAEDTDNSQNEMGDAKEREFRAKDRMIEELKFKLKAKTDENDSLLQTIMELRREIQEVMLKNKNSIINK